MPVSKKVRFSDKTIVVQKQNKFFKKSNYALSIRELPGVVLTYFNMKKKSALEAAIKAAPGCSFDIKEFGGHDDFKLPLERIAHLNSHTIEHLQSQGIMA
jgi:hypothetical protein